MSCQPLSSVLVYWLNSQEKCVPVLSNILLFRVTLSSQGTPPKKVETKIQGGAQWEKKWLWVYDYMVKRETPCWPKSST